MIRQSVLTRFLRSRSSFSFDRRRKSRAPNLTVALVMLAALGNIPVHAAEKRREASSAKSAASASVPPGQGFDAFQLIVERNIFNPNRVGRTRAAPEEKPARIDEIALVGTMNYDKGLVAFFESSDSAYRKALREGESIADFKLQRITADGVELLRDEKPVALKVTQQLRRAEGGDWVVTTSPVQTDGRPGVAGSTFTRTNESAPTEIPADASEVLKRLLKKRDKQLK